MDVARCSAERLRVKGGSVIGVDTGGTFTDVVALEADGSVRVGKVQSNPSDPASAVAQGLAGMRAEALERLVHGTTVATNALLEHKTAPIALITTAGFEDIIEIGRQNRSLLYELHPTKPASLVPRDMRFGVTERVLHDGTVLHPMDEEEARRVLETIASTGAEALAVCLLHSYANPAHEEVIGRLADGMGLAVSLSCRVLPEFREYERTATVAVNAALQPIMGRYLKKLERAVGKTHLTVMQSAGGIMPGVAAARLPVHTVLSGPAGGVTAAGWLARQLGLEKIITFDMGGTSTDVSLYGAAPTLTSDKLIGGYPIRVPMIDIHTVGAGGGSIAYRDSGGSLKVGPRSAGADPGPVCYGKGEDLTVTDANLFLGRLEPSFFLGGRMKIFADRVGQRMDRLAAALGLTPEETAEGIITVANSVMERAIRVISVERGHDPADFTLVSFGGAGGLHAVELARSLGIPRVLFPAHAGVFSALGLVLADFTRDWSRTILTPWDRISSAELEAMVASMVEEGAAELEREGLDPKSALAHPSVDLRYRGQSYELNVSLAGDVEEGFHAAHERRYGYRRPESPLELVNVKVRLVIPAQTPRLGGGKPRKGSACRRAPGQRALIWMGERLVVAVVSREDLREEERVEGPAIIGDSHSTLFLPPGSGCIMEEQGNLVVFPLSEKSA